MKKTTAVGVIISPIMVGVSVTTTETWYIPALWGVTATIWGFTAGMEYADEAWRDAL